MKKITDKDVEALKAGKKVTKGFIHMQLDDKGRLNLWSDINTGGTPGIKAREETSLESVSCKRIQQCPYEA